MANYSQAQVFPILSYANTFADMMLTTNELVQQNNDLASNNFIKQSGTLYLNDGSLGLQVNTAAIISGAFQVIGTSSSTYIQKSLRVDGAVNFTNTATSLLANGEVLIYGANTGLYVANNANVSGTFTVGGNEIVGGALGVFGVTTLSNTVSVSGNTNISNTLFVSGTSTFSSPILGQNLNLTGSALVNSLQSNTSVQTGSLNVTGTGTINIVQATNVNTASLEVVGTTITNVLQSNTSINAATMSVTGTDFVNFTQANTAVNTTTLSVTTTGYMNVVQANTLVNTATFSATGTGFVNILQANSVINTTTFSATGTGYVNYLQANSAVNTSNISVTNTLYSNNIIANTSITVPTLNVSGTLLANSSTAFFNNITALNQFTVGGTFVVNGTTVNNSNNITLNAGSSIGATSTIVINRGTSGANAAIRWNEISKYWDILDVNNGVNYSQIMTANMISTSLTSISTSTVASSSAANTLYTYLTSNVSVLQASLTSNVSNLQSYITSNVASIAGVDATQNTSIIAAFVQANAAYSHSNTTSNVFVGTTGSAAPLNSSITLSSNNGVIVSGPGGNTLYINTPQNLQTTGTPTFSTLTLSNPLTTANGGSGATTFTNGVLFYNGSNFASLANVSNAGVYGNTTSIPSITVDNYGRVVSISNNSITVPPGTAVYANAGQLTANTSTGNVALGLATSGVTATTYGSSSTIPAITVDQYGRVTSASNISVSFAGTYVYANSGQLTANVNTGNIALGLATTGVTATTYGNATNIPTITVDTYGRITGASNTSIMSGSSSSQMLYNSSGSLTGATNITTDGTNITTNGNVFVGTTTSGNNSVLYNATFQAYKEKVNIVGTVSTSTYNIDCTKGNIFDITLGASAITFTFINPPQTNVSQPITIILRQGSGSSTATFTNAHYTGGATPTLSTGASQIDVLTFFTYNGGSFWFGTFAMANVS
jgi:hypothetical protein